MSRLADLLLLEQRTINEREELRSLVNRLEATSGDIAGFATGPTGEISYLRAGYIVLDTSGLRTGQSEVRIGREGIRLFQTSGATEPDVQTTIGWINKSDLAQFFAMIGVYGDADEGNLAVEANSNNAFSAQKAKGSVTVRSRGVSGGLRRTLVSMSEWTRPRSGSRHSR